MRKILFAGTTAFAILVAFCTAKTEPSDHRARQENVAPAQSGSTKTVLPDETTHSADKSPGNKSPTPARFAGRTEVQWDIYDPDPQHLWSRLFRQLYGRVASDGKEYGQDNLDPLLWYETEYMLDDPSFEHTIRLLDEFLAQGGDKLITDPLKRAVFQRDLWAVFDWLAQRTDVHAFRRLELQKRLARVIQEIALASEQIRSLPDNYQMAVRSGIYTDRFDPDTPFGSFLPADLLKTDGEWVSLGREGGPIATTHTESAPFFGRSTFLVFIRLPGGHEDTIQYLDALNKHATSDVPGGTEVALVRQMMLIDNQGNVIPSPIIESVQIRHYESSMTQRFFEFVLDRELLFQGVAGGLQALDSDDRAFNLFNATGVDVFVEFEPTDVERHMTPVLSRCFACHFRPDLGITGAKSLLSYNREQFVLPNGQSQILIPTTKENEAEVVVGWKLERADWKALKGYWQKQNE